MILDESPKSVTQIIEEVDCLAKSLHWQKQQY